MSLGDTVKNLAALARLGMSDQEREKLAHEIEAILAYVSEVKEASGGDAAAEAGVLRNVMREDGPATPSGTYTEALLRAAPAREGNYIRVKKIL